MHICCIYTYTRNHEPTTPAATPSPGIRCTATARDTLAKFYIEELCERTGVDLKKATVKDPPWNTALPLKFDDWNRWQFRNQNGPEFQGTWLFTFFFWGGNVKIWYSFFKRRSFVKKDTVWEPLYVTWVLLGEPVSKSHKDPPKIGHEIDIQVFSASKVQIVYQYVSINEERLRQILEEWVKLCLHYATYSHFGPPAFLATIWLSSRKSWKGFHFTPTQW